MTEIAAAKPIQENKRIQNLDVIRGVALFGILLMNITMFGLEHQAYGDPSVTGGNTGLDLWAWITTNMVFEGTQRAMFSILFGAGVILMTSSMEAAGRTDTADIYFRRNIWLVIFGLVHSYFLLWTGEILFYYGVIALFLYSFRHLKSRNLLLIGVFGVAFGFALNSYDANKVLGVYNSNAAAEAILAGGGTLTEDQQGAVDTWIGIAKALKPAASTIAENIETYQGSYAGIFLLQMGENAHYHKLYTYRYFFDIFGMMIVGMALFKMGVLTLKRSTGFYWGMALGGYAIGLSVNYYETMLILNSNFSIISFMKANATYDIGRIGMVAGHLGLLLLFCRSGWFQWLQRSLAAVGRMALTNYVSHSIICAFVFFGFGFSQFGELARHELYYVVFSIWAAQLIVSPIWLRHYRFGPLEWLWRSLTYMKRQPMKRTSGGKGDSTEAPQPI